MNYKINIKSIKLFIGYLIIVEMVLGGTGNVLNIPIRVSLMFGSLCVLLLIATRQNLKYEKGILKVCSYLIIFLAILVGTSVIRGYSFSSSMEDINSILSIVYVIIYYIILYKNKEFIYKFINLFINLTCILSLITLIIFILSYLLGFIGFNMVDWLNDFDLKYNYGIITDWLYSGKFARVYLTNGFFMQSALGIVIGSYVLNLGIDIKLFKAKTIILILGIFSSNTRGYWLGAIIIIVQLIIVAKGVHRRKIIKGVTIVSFISMIVLNVFFSEIVSDIYMRFLSVNDFSTDISNYIRKIQIECLMNGIIEKPLLGWGLGSSINGYSDIINRSGRYVEIYYLDMIYRIGIIGIIGLLLFLLVIYRRYYEIIKSDQVNYEQKNLSKVFICIVNSALVINMTNPYFRGTNGIFIIFFTTIILNSIWSNRNINLGE